MCLTASGDVSQLLRLMCLTFPHEGIERDRTAVPQFFSLRSYGCPRHGDDELSSGAPGFEKTDRIRRLGQRIRPVDDRRDASSLNQFAKELQVVATLLRDNRTHCLAGAQREQNSFDNPANRPDAATRGVTAAQDEPALWGEHASKR